MRRQVWLVQPAFKLNVTSIGDASRIPRRAFHHVFPLQRLGNRSNRPVESLYADTSPPTPKQSAAAETFFKTHLPTKSWTATEWRSQPHSDKAYLTPEVAFLGRSNSGKSSLLNGILMNPSLCRVGPKPGKTITMHAWSLSPIDPRSRGAKKGHQGDMEPKLTVLDMPGYGHGARGDWGRDIMKYLKSRRQLRRAFVLVNPAHGLKDHDLQMLELLRGHGISHQVIATKCDHDAVKDLPKLLHNVQEALQSSAGSGRRGPVLMTISDILAVGGLGDGKANQRVTFEQMRGLSDVRWAILRAAGLEEYVVSIHENGGVPKKGVKLVQSPMSDTGISSEQISKKEEDITPFDTFSSKSTLQEADASQQKSPLIGIGLDELMEMTTSLKASHPSPPQAKGTGTSSMRQRMIARRASPAKAQLRRRV